MATLGLLLSRPSGLPEGERPTVSVPFACDLRFEVSQAHDTGSHLQNDTWAWDFRMPSGVPIVAASDGVVRMARGDSTVGGCNPKFARQANYVVIDHGNGYETQYLHFSAVTVKAGQKVSAGELIGYSGKTGWACGSHLHFKVARREHGGWNNKSVPAFIEGHGDPQAAMLVSAPRCTGSGVRVYHAWLEPGVTGTSQTVAAGASSNEESPGLMPPAVPKPHVLPADATR